LPLLAMARAMVTKIKTGLSSRSMRAAVKWSRTGLVSCLYMIGFKGRTFYENVAGDEAIASQVLPLEILARNALIKSQGNLGFSSTDTPKEPVLNGAGMARSRRRRV